MNVQQQNKVSFKTLIDEVITAGKLEMADRFLTADRPDYQEWGLPPEMLRGYEGFKRIIGMIRAATENMSAGHVVQGGSTITQQLAKNLLLTQERTLTRKLQEAVLALWIEHKFRKDEIIELGMVKFDYLPDGRIAGVSNTFSAFNEPSIPIPPEITAITGITDRPARVPATQARG